MKKKENTLLPNTASLDCIHKTLSSTKFSAQGHHHFFFLEEKLNTVMPWRIINSKLASFKPFFAFFWLAKELNETLSDDALRACDRIEMLLPGCC